MSQVDLYLNKETKTHQINKTTVIKFKRRMMKMRMIINQITMTRMTMRKRRKLRNMGRCQVIQINPEVS